jgi:succinate-acetate transporter protein
MLLKSEKYINTTKQLLILIGYGIFMFCMIFFVFVEGSGVTFDPVTWVPIWKLPIFLYLIIGESIFAVGPVFYLSYRAYHKFEDEQLKKKWKNFIYGFGAYMIFLYTIFISNKLDDPGFRTVAGIIGIICAFVGGYLMYIGVTRQLEK